MLGNLTTCQPIGLSPPFKFPRPVYHVRNFQYYTTVNGEDFLWSLCRTSRCSVCQTSPESFIFHDDCFWFSKRKSPTLTPCYVWKVGFWSLPYLENCYQPRVLWVFPKLSAYMHCATNVLTSIITTPDIIKLLERLPPELCQLVASYCPESPLWRYSVAITWPPKTFMKLEESNLVTVSLRDLPRWIRGTILPNSSQIMPEKSTLVRISLDNDGIQEVEFLSSWPIPSSRCPPVAGQWYIVKDFGDKKVQFQSKVKYTWFNRYFC